MAAEAAMAAEAEATAATIGEADAEATVAAPPRRVVLVFDYDWSLINANSDEMLFQQLAPPVLDFIHEQAGQRRGEWNKIIDEALFKLQHEHGVGLERIREALAAMPVLDGMLDAVKEAHAAGAEVHLLSDASEEFIGAFLAHHGLTPLVASVRTNGNYTSEAGHLRLRPYHLGEPHRCALCPPNLCKGKALAEDMALLNDSTRVVYVGDGSGDFCAATRLRAHDLLLVRDDEAYPRARGLVKRIAKFREEHPLRAEVRAWRSGIDVRDAVRSVLPAAQASGSSADATSRSSA